MAEEKVLIDIQINYQLLAKQIDEVKNKIVQLKESNKQLNAELAQAKLAGNTQEIEKLNAAILQNEAETKKATQAQRAYEQTAVNVAKATQAQTGSIEQQRAQLSILTAEYNKLSKEQRNSEAGIELRDKIKGISDELKANEKAIGDNRRNVGNYAEGVLEAAAANDKMGGSVGGLSQAFKVVQSNVQSAKDAYSNAVTVMASATNNIAQSFTSFKDSAKEGFSDIKSGNVAKGFSTIGTSGVTAFRAIGVAVAASGVGLILIAVAALINYLRQLDPVVEAFERGFAAIGAVIDVVGKAIVDFGKTIIEAVKNPLEFIKNFSFANMVNGFKEMTAEAQRAGDAAAELKRQEQELEDLQRENLKTLGELRRESEKFRTIEADRTKSTKERIEASKQASDAEKKAIEIQIQEAEAANKIAQGRLQEAIKNKGELANVNDDIRKDAIEAEEAVADLKFKLDNKDAENKRALARTINEDHRERIAATIGLLNNELKQKELIGRKDFELQRSISEQQLKSELSAEGLSNLQIEKLRSDHITRLAEIDKAELDFRKELLQQAEDITIDGMKDGLEKQLLQEGVNLQRKLDQIKGDSEEEAALRLALIQQSAEKTLAIQAKFAEQFTQQRLDALENESTLFKEQLNKKTEEELVALQLSLAKRGATQEEFAQQASQIRINAATAELEHARAVQNEREQIDLALYNAELERLQKALDEKRLTQEQYHKAKQDADLKYAAAEKKTFDDTQKDIVDATKDFNQQQLALLQDLNSQRIAEEQKYTQAAEALYQNLAATIDTILRDSIDKTTERVTQQIETSLEAKTELLDEEKEKELQANQDLFDAGLIGQEDFEAKKASIEDSYTQKTKDAKIKAEAEKVEAERKAANLKKAITIVEIGVDTAKNVAEIQSRVALIASEIALHTASGNFVLAGIATGALAAAQAQVPVAIAIGAIQAAAVAAKQFEEGGATDTVYNIFHKYHPKNIGTFQNGGHQHFPSIGLIGEKGPEWVSPNWMMRDEVTGPIIHGLELYRTGQINKVTVSDMIAARGIQPFYTGGATSVIRYADGGFTSTNATQPAFESVMMERMISAIENQPQKVVVVEDINAAQSSKVQVEQGANF